jgi:hypothetical protein
VFGRMVDQHHKSYGLLPEEGEIYNCKESLIIKS